MKLILIFFAALFTTSLYGCSSNDTSTVNNPQGNNSSGSGKILIAYFSLWGNVNYPSTVDASTSASIVVDENVRYGATEYIARIIQKNTGGAIQRIETRDAYPADFQAVISQNHDEMGKAYLPPLKSINLDMEQYDTVFIGYPVWATTIPQAIISFLSEYDFSGKTIIPFCTHDGYGSGRSFADIKKASPQAAMLDGIAIEAKNVPSAETTVNTWINTLGITQTAADTGESPIAITIGNIVLDGVIYDTPLALEIKTMFPLTVSMVGFGGREYYGGISKRPANTGKTQRNFINGDITYCPQNNTLAIFYAQTDRPNLGMDVIPIGKVTSDLAVFNTLGSRVDIAFALR
jgi:flavodoxin